MRRPTARWTLPHLHRRTRHPAPRLRLPRRRRAPPPTPSAPNAASNGFDPDNGCEVRLWDRRSLKEAVAAMKGHEQAVTGVALLGGKSAVSGSKDGSLRVWNLQGGGCLGTGALGEGSADPGAAGGITKLASAHEAEAGAQVFASSTTGALHALRLRENGVEVAATAEPRDGEGGKGV